MEFEHRIKRALLWMRAAVVADAAALAAVCAAVLILAAIFTGKLGLWSVDWETVSVSCVVASLLIILAVLHRRRLRSADAALALDREFSLQERLVTALHLRREQTLFAPVVLEDANRAAMTVNPRAVARTHLFMPLVLTGVLALVSMLTWRYLPEYDVLGRKAQKAAQTVRKAAVTAQAKKLEQLEKKLSSALPTADAPLTATKKAALDIASLRNQLTEAHAPSARDAMSKLSSLSEKIDQARQEAKKQGQVGQGKLPKEPQTGGMTAQLERALRRGDMEQAKAELSRLQEQSKTPGQSPSDNSQLGAELSRLGGSVEGQEQLSAGLGEAGKSLQEGKPDAAQPGFEKAKAAMSRIAAAQSEMRQLEDALAEIEKSKAELAQAENSAESMQAGGGERSESQSGEAAGDRQQGASGNREPGGSQNGSSSEGKSAGDQSGQKSGGAGKQQGADGKQDGAGEGAQSGEQGKSGGESGGEQSQQAGSQEKQGGSQSGERNEASSGETGEKFAVGGGLRDPSSGSESRGGQQQSSQGGQSGSQQSQSQSGGSQESAGSSSGGQSQGSQGSSSQSGTQSASSGSGSQQGGAQSGGQSGKGQGQGGAPDWGVGSTNLDESNPAGAPLPKPNSGAPRQANRDSRWTEEFIKLYDPRSMATKQFNTQTKGQIGEGQFDYSVDVEGAGRREAPKVDASKAFMDYREAQKDALGKEDIPLGYKEFVKSYFDSIEPPETAPAPAAATK